MCKIYPAQLGIWWKFWKNLLFHVLSNYACKFAINLFHNTWGPFQNGNLLYFLLKIQISNGCNVLNISGNHIKDIIVSLSFLISGSKVVEYTPSAGYLVEILENLLFHVLSNYACKFAINLFPITWGPFQNVNLLYFLLKIQISNGCNVLNIAGNPIKDITVNLSFLSSGSKVVQNIPPQLGIWWKFWKIYFSFTVQWCMQICYKPFPITWGAFQNVNLLYFLLKIQISNGCNVLNIAGNPIKDIIVYLSFLRSGSKVVEYTPSAGYLVEILENLLFHVLSIYACKFAINLFPITWGPFQNVNLLVFLLKIQISNGSNVLNIAGNPIKDIIVNLSFLSLGSKVMQNIPCTAGYLVEILENLLFHVLSNYACKFAINLFPIIWRPFQNFNILYVLLKIQISNGCNVLNIAGNPIKDIIVSLSFLSSGSKVVEYTPSAGYLVEIFGKSIFDVLSNYACKFAINLFPITWGPFQNVNLLYFLLKIQISNGCNVLNIAGNPIKDIILNFSFLSSGSKVVQNIPCPAGVSGGYFGKSNFFCTVHLCMQICHKPFPITWGPFQNVNLLIFLLKIQISNGCNVLNIAGNPIKVSL